MSLILTNEEKINIVNQHLRNLEFLKYNTYLDSLEASAVSSSEELITQIENRKVEVEAKIKILQDERQSLLQDGV
jgi:hypothetical protein